MMQRFVPAIALSLVGLNAPFAVAAKSDFRVYNSTGQAIWSLRVSESRFTDWGPDILGSHILTSGENTRVLFGNRSPNACQYDFRAVFADGSVAENRRVNVCNNDWLHYR